MNFAPPWSKPWLKVRVGLVLPAATGSGFEDVEPGNRQDQALGLTLARVVLRLAGDAEHLEQPACLEIGRILRQVAVEARADAAAGILREVHDAGVLIDGQSFMGEASHRLDWLGGRNLTGLGVQRNPET